VIQRAILVVQSIEDVYTIDHQSLIKVVKLSRGSDKPAWLCLFSNFRAGSSKLDRELVQDVHDLLEMLERQRLLPCMRERVSSPKGILNLTSVRVERGELAHLLWRDVDNSAEATLLLDEGAPDTDFGVDGQFGEAQCDVDTRKEGVIEGLHSVGGQEQDTAIVFQVPQAVTMR
jgi:hypothetical protein